MNETSKTQSAPNSAPAAGEQQSAKAAAANAAVQPQNVSDERKTFDTYWNGLDSAGATDAEIEMCEYAAWQAWQARPRHCLALPLSAYPAGTTYRAPATSAGGQSIDVLMDLRDRVDEMRNNLETFGPYSREAARVVLDGVVDEIDDVAAKLEAAGERRKCTNCDATTNADNPVETCDACADRAAATSAAGQAWVSVDDRLPEDDTEVIVLYWPYDNRENKQVAGHAHFYDDCFFAEDWNPHHPPSHWMPMPAIPTDDRAAAQGAAGQVKP